MSEKLAEFHKLVFQNKNKKKQTHRMSRKEIFLHLFPSVYRKIQLCAFWIQVSPPAQETVSGSSLVSSCDHQLCTVIPPVIWGHGPIQSAIQLLAPRLTAAIATARDNYNKEFSVQQLVGTLVICCTLYIWSYLRILAYFKLFLQLNIFIRNRFLCGQQQHFL